MTRAERFSGVVFHLQHLVRIERRQVVEENFLTSLIGRFKVDRFNFDQREIAFTFLRWTNLAADCVAGAQVKLSICDGET
jgi:hypothetical protein